MIKRWLSYRCFLLALLLFCCPALWAASSRTDPHHRNVDQSLAQGVDLDVDGDGDLDYVLQENGQLELWINLGADQWNKQGLIPTSTLDPELLVADVNHDGYADLIICDRNSRFAPEIWSGRRNGSLEKSGTSFPLSISTPEQNQARNSPLRSPQVLAQEGSQRECKSVVREFRTTTCPILPPGFVPPSKAVYSHDFATLLTAPRSPPAGLSE
ncbi:MAG TPA: FG-GAP repeat protein [Acidobacteriota bacterium]|jgi:hypothetical protein|nr:FG-GAP repeat protein [Acidobacteriota bacterium]